jgi:hypothetical protein
LNPGRSVTTQPSLTLTLWGGFAASLTAAAWVLGHRIPDRAHLPLTLLVALGFAAYAGVSILAYERTPHWSWDPIDTFGLLGNRNHTATALVMGALAALGALWTAIRARRGGSAGVAALALAFVLAGLLGFSISRAGILLLILGMLSWLAGLALKDRKRYFSKKTVWTAAAFALIAGNLFWWTDNTLKSRLEESWDRLESPVQANEGSMPTALAGQAFDLRSLIYQDTVRMVAAEPVVGVGLGQFPYVFPQYRHQAAVGARAWHPESNWGLLAAEAGWPVALLLAAGVAGLFFKAFRVGKHHRGWPLTLGTLLAAAIVPLHGLFDVPAYHIGLAWPALVLLALVFRPGDAPVRPAGGLYRWTFRLFGLPLLAGGCLIFYTGGPAHSLPGPFTGPVPAAVATLKAHYTQDAAEKADPVKTPPTLNPDGSPVDQLEAAQKVVNAALKVTPLEPELHYWRGLLSVNFSDEEAIADQAFAIERLLEPDWVSIPWRQGLAWLSIDGKRSVTLWQEALRRASAAHQIHPGVYWSPEQLEKEIKSVTEAHPEVWKAWEERGK